MNLLEEGCWCWNWQAGGLGGRAKRFMDEVKEVTVS